MAWVPPEQASLLADIHSHDERELTINTTPTATNALREPGHFGGGGQLISTSDDYWRFTQMLLNGGEFDGRRYLSPSTIDMMAIRTAMP